MKQYKLNQEKTIALKHILTGNDISAVVGYAGTGKTFLISILRKEIFDNWKTKNVAFVSFTGKAIHVMRTKLNESKSFFQEDFCGTIHSFIYRPEMKYDKKTKKMIISKWIKKERDELRDLYDLIFVDEASMVSEMLWKDLSFYGIPMIAVGDHGQIPPVGDNFNLMSNPQFDPASAIQVQTLPNMPGSIYDAGIQQQQQQQQAQAALAKTGGFKRKHKMRGGADLAPAVIQVQNPPSYAGAGTQDMYKQLTLLLALFVA
jgi:ATP-dependent exoDNAse (exonuclease V) alpha subunit